MIDDKWKLKGLHIRDCRHGMESETINNRIKTRLFIIYYISARGLIVYNFVVMRGEEGGKLFVNETLRHKDQGYKTNNQ